jgi:hypothetical protein
MNMTQTLFLKTLVPILSHQYTAGISESQVISENNRKFLSEIGAYDEYECASSPFHLSYFIFHLFPGRYALNVAMSSV